MDLQIHSRSDRKYTSNLKNSPVREREQTLLSKRNEQVNSVSSFSCTLTDSLSTINQTQEPKVGFHNSPSTTPEMVKAEHRKNHTFSHSLSCNRVHTLCCPMLYSSLYPSPQHKKSRNTEPS